MEIYSDTCQKNLVFIDVIEGKFGVIFWYCGTLLNLSGLQKLGSVCLNDISISYHNVISMYFVFDLCVSRCHFMSVNLQTSCCMYSRNFFCCLCHFGLSDFSN